MGGSLLVVLCGLAVGGQALAQLHRQVFNEDRKLVGELADGLEYLGLSLDMADGRLVAGAWLSGSVYVFETATWQQTRQLLPSDGIGGEFGTSVAIDDPWIVVGAPAHPTDGLSYAGAVYVYDVKSGFEVARLLPDDPAEFAAFGQSVAVAGDLIAVGAPSGLARPFRPGAVYLFDARTGEQLAKLQSEDAAPFDLAGVDVAIDGGLVIAGAPEADNVETSDGVVYLFDSETGEEVGRLAASNPSPYLQFGTHLDADDGTLVVGVPVDGQKTGAVYLFDLASRKQLRKMVWDGGNASDGFGESLSISGDTVVVGAKDNGRNGESSGIAVVFDATTGDVVAELLPSDGGELDLFGTAVAVDGDAIAVGSPRDDDAGPDAGAAYIFSVPAGQGCDADWDANGVVNSADVGAFLSDYFLDLLNGTLTADFNGDGVVNAADVGAFLSVYFPELNDPDCNGG